MNKRTKYNKNHRRGALSVEVAMVAPFVFLLVFGLMEWSRVEMIRHATSTAAFNAARQGTIPGTTAAEAKTFAEDILDVYMIRNASVTSTVDDVESSISVSVPLSNNAWFLSKFFSGVNIQRSFKLNRE